MLKISNIKTKRENNFFMLQVCGNTIQGIWKKQHGYTSDTFSTVYPTITEAKQHTAKLLQEGYFGEVFKEMFVKGCLSANNKK